MSTEKTKLEQIATREERQAILRMFLNHKTIDAIAIPYGYKGGIEFVSAVLQAGLMPDTYDNLPDFDLGNNTFSDEAFTKHLSFLNLPLDESDFEHEEYEILINAGINKHWQLLSSPLLPIEASKIPNYFSFHMQLPVVFLEHQRQQLV